MGSYDGKKLVLNDKEREKLTLTLGKILAIILQNSDVKYVGMCGCHSEDKPVIYLKVELPTISNYEESGYVEFKEFKIDITYYKKIRNLDLYNDEVLYSNYYQKKQLKIKKDTFHYFTYEDKLDIYPSLDVQKIKKIGIKNKKIKKTANNL